MMIYVTTHYRTITEIHKSLIYTFGLNTVRNIYVYSNHVLITSDKKECNGTHRKYRANQRIQPRNGMAIIFLMLQE